MLAWRQQISQPPPAASPSQLGLNDPEQLGKRQPSMSFRRRVREGRGGQKWRGEERRGQARGGEGRRGEERSRSTFASLTAFRWM
eukprot:748470-Hanusia_phi.AAC.3